MTDTYQRKLDGARERATERARAALLRRDGDVAAAGQLMLNWAKENRHLTRDLVRSGVDLAVRAALQNDTDQDAR